MTSGSTTLLRLIGGRDPSEEKHQLESTPSENAEKMSPVRVVILSTADFASAAWTNKQHLARELARRVPVTYIESFGLRQPTLGATDLRRMLGRLRSSRTVTTSSPNTWGVEVVHPIVIPFHGFATVRGLNKYIVKHLPVDGGGRSSVDLLTGHVRARRSICPDGLPLC